MLGKRLCIEARLRCLQYNSIFGAITLFQMTFRTAWIDKLFDVTFEKQHDNKIDEDAAEQIIEYMAKVSKSVPGCVMTIRDCSQLIDALTLLKDAQAAQYGNNNELNYAISYDDITRDTLSKAVLLKGDG